MEDPLSPGARSHPQAEAAALSHAADGDASVEMIFASSDSDGGDGAALRRRRGGGGKWQKKSTRRTRLSFHIDEPRSDKLTAAQERVFLNMYMRKAQRRIRGKRKDDSLCCELSIVVALVVVIIVLGWDNHPDKDDEWKEGDTIGLVFVLLWVMIIVATFFVFEDSPYARMLRWMVIYIPLVAYVTSLSFYEEMRHIEESDTPVTALGILIPNEDLHHWLLALTIAAEAIVFLTFMTFYKFFPLFLTSRWVQNNPKRAAKIWRVGVVQDWTMSYRGHNPHGTTRCNLDHTCKYEGETDPVSGLPDGLGRWLDDAWEGEMLTGYWKQGMPVAPFSSWNVGTDDAVVAVRVAYFKATDDAYEKNKFRPTNDQHPPECGVASVECSVSGSFYKHLPCATLVEGPHVVDSMPSEEKNNPVRECLSHLFQVGEVDKAGEGAGGGLSSINIQATDPRGVQVLGHVYEPTGRYYSPGATNITVEVEWGGPGEGGGGGMGGDSGGHGPGLGGEYCPRLLQKTLFMPKAATTPLAKLVEVEVEDSSEEEEDGDKDEEAIYTNGREKLSPTTARNDLEGQHQSSVIKSAKWSAKQMKTATLRVRDWVPVAYKEALIFCPGYNSCMKDSLQSFGQFLAMTKLTRHVYPFVFVWPGSYSMGYLYASSISATDINRRNMLKLIKGLGAAGINRIHFMTHSMGVQTLLGAFCDKYNEDGERIGRSEVSMCFQLDPEYDDSGGPVEGKRQQYSNQMVCKSVTLLNPDFPVRAFADRAFLSIRRICQTVTVVGDRNDRALYWSSIINGMVAPRVGYHCPEVLRPSLGPYEQSKWARMERVGCSIDELYFSSAVAQQYHSAGRDKEFRRQLFDKGAPIDFSGRAEDSKYKNHFWMDMDVIDMTGLDTNIKGMRHSGFSLNGMLLKDLEELISSGKRAMKRSTLLYREGNIFSYAHAPAFVVQ